MMRPEDAPTTEQERHQGIGGFVKSIFGGGGGNEGLETISQKGDVTTSQKESSSESQATQIATESKEARGTVTTSSSKMSAQSTNTYHVDTKESDEKWDEARAMTAKAQEQSRIAQTMSVEASATKRESAEAQRRAEIARGADQDLLARIREVHPEHALAEYQETSKKLEFAKGAAASKRVEIDRLEREMGDLNDEVNRKTAVLQGEVDATKAAQHEMDDIDVKIGRMNAAAKNEQAQAVQNCKDAEKCQQEARAARASAKEQQDLTSKAQAAVTDLQRRLEIGKQNADAARRKMAAAEHKAEDAEGELSTFEESAKHHAAEAEVCKSKVPSLMKAKDGALNKLKSAQSKLESATKDAAAMAGDLKNREGLDKSMKDALAKIQKQGELKKEELARVKAEHEKAQADLKPLQDERERQRRIFTSEVEQAKELEIKFKSFRIEADRAQARKEELWTKAQSAGELADKEVDEGFVKLGGDKELTHQGEKTKRVASQSGGINTKVQSSSMAAHKITTKVEE